MPPPHAEAPATATGRTVAEPPPPRPAEPPPGDIPHFEGGQLAGYVSREGAEQLGLTVVELGDAWTPGVFREEPSLGRAGRQPYRATFLALADEKDERGRRVALNDRHLELFGIFPTFRILRERLADDERHACHEAIDNAPIAGVERALRPGVDVAGQRRRRRQLRWTERRLQRAARQQGVETIEALGALPRYARKVEAYQRQVARIAAISAVQGHLQCDGFLGRRARSGIFDAWTGSAMKAWQRRHMVISLGNRLDQVTRQTLGMASRELDFISALRVLRERVVSATGLIEDGSASGIWEQPLGRQLDPDPEFRWVERLKPLPRGAPDLIGRATEAAAQALGWTSPEAARAWLDEHQPTAVEHQLVALRLPPPPAYHQPHMALRTEIDRGDVWYGFPYTDDGRPRHQPVRRRPTLVIYAQDAAGDIPLVRWNTTIGGWQEEIAPDGTVGMRYKNSDTGPRVWRDVIAGPAWLPPPSTPDEELLRERNGVWELKTSITGPGYESAYGLSLIVHHQVQPARAEGEEPHFWDNGIRSHGSVNYRSILRGYSHGCHRLFNHLAVRMTSFVLSHRNHSVRGQVPAAWSREFIVEDQEEPLRLELDTRGFLFELTPPVPVEVRRGRVRGQPRRPPEAYFPLPSELRAAAEAQALAAEAALPAPAEVYGPPAPPALLSPPPAGAPTPTSQN